ncbi:MAG: hypothetical protein QXL27_06760 [Candidatus Bathyarchaeia archaeon]
MSVVATCSLSFKIDLKRLARDFPECVKLNRRYPKYKCAYVKIEGMKGRATLFGSGEMISVGAKSVEDAKNDLTLTYNLLYLLMHGM